MKYMEVLRRLGQDIPELDEQMCHIIASGMFNGVFEIVVHDMPKNKALRYVDQLRDFYTAGWLKLMWGNSPHLFAWWLVISNFMINIFNKRRDLF